MGEVKFLSREEDESVIQSSVKSFRPPDLQEGLEQKSHKQIKSTFKPNLTRKDSQFRLSDLVANQLSVEEEDKKKFEEAVANEVEKQVHILFESSRKKGFEDGFAVGKKEGFDKEVQGFRESEKRLRDVIEAVTSMTPKIFAAHEGMIMGFITQFASLVARREVSLNKDYLQSILRDIVEKCGATEGIKIWLNKDDYKIFEDIKTKLNSQFGGLKGLAFEPDEAIEPKGCRVETEFGVIKTSLNQQLQAVEKAILEKVPKVDDIPT